MIRQLLYAVVVFLVFFVGLGIRSFIIDRVFNDREWFYEKHWKFALIASLLIAIALFVYLRVTGQMWL